MDVFSVRAKKEVKEGLVSFSRTGGIGIGMLLEDVFNMLKRGDLVITERHLTFGGAYSEFVKEAEMNGKDPDKILEQVTRQLQNPPRNKKGET